ncbi:MAG: TlpA family protein disulfide reductase [Hymenobacteraceae bacterium]|nr:TlpA family protein disulfide reductase [Hymenobacteraceae bacterium]
MLALAGAGILAFGSACTERATSSDFDPKNPQPTAESAPKPPVVEAREPDSVAYTDGGVAPEISSVSFFANTRGMHLQDLRGKYVLLQIFTLNADSIANRKLIGRYNEMYKALRTRGNFQFLSVLTGTDIRAPKALLGRANLLQISFPVALDADGSAATAYKAASLPATYLIDPEGKIIFTRAGAGGTDYTENAVRQKLNLPLIPERD